MTSSLVGKMGFFTTLVLDSLLILLLSSSISIDAAKWSYDGENGPEFWSTLHGGELCDGNSQSPINIDEDTVTETSFEEWNLEGYDELTLPGTKIVNNGHTDQVTLEGDFKVSGGGLPSTYTAVQFHFHWGDDDNQGSEHTKNGNAYPAEIHIVHYDSANYDSIYAAITEPGGLAVLGFWVEVGEENEAFKPIVNSLKSIVFKDQEYEFTAGFKPKDLMPSDTDKFYRYSGSLTTPGCFESVVWTVFDQPIQMSEEQLKLFRDEKLTPIGENGTLPDMPVPIGHNYRPTQDLNGRTVHVGTVQGSGGHRAVISSGTLLSALLVSFLACVFCRVLSL